MIKYSFIFLLLTTLVFANDLAKEEQTQQNIREKEFEAAKKILWDHLGIYIERQAKLSLEEWDPINFPFLPLILHPATLSLTLANVTLEGFNNFVLDTSVTDFAGTATWEHLSLTSGCYSASGHINTLPFAGKSELEISFYGLEAYLSFSPISLINYCPKLGSTVFNIDLNRLKVEFKDLNPGEDTGEVINSMISNVGRDIMKYITQQLNGDWHDVIDPIAVNLISKAMNDYTGPGSGLIGGCDVSASEAEWSDILEIPVPESDNIFAEFHRELFNKLATLLNSDVLVNEINELVKKFDTNNP